MVMPGFAQPREAGRDRRLVDQQRAFGDLGRDPGRIHAGGRNLVEQPVVETVARQVLGQEVDRQLEILERAFPRRGAAQRLALDQPRQPLVEPGGRRPR